jgi:hypothetical protein
VLGVVIGVILLGLTLSSWPSARKLNARYITIQKIQKWGGTEEVDWRKGISSRASQKPEDQ